MNAQELISQIFKSALVAMLTFFSAAPVYAQAPVNDDCSGAITLTVDTICHMDTFNNFNATASVGVANPTCGFYQGGDVWFKVTVPSSGNVRFEVRNVSGINPQYAIYTGSCGSLTQYSCNQLDADKTISDPSLANQTLYIRVYKYNNSSGGTFQICVWEPPVPSNDNCADAIMLPVGTSCSKVAYSSRYSIGESTSVAPNPTCGFYQGGDVWFKFIMPASGIIRFELTGQAPQYAVYSGSCGSFTQLLCAQLDAENMFIDTAFAGDTLYLRVYKYNDEEGGDFEVCLWEPTVPANDDCGNAIFIATDTVCNKQAYSNAYTTREATSIAPNPTCGFFQGGDVWFRFVAPASGIFRVEAQGFGMNPQYAVYSGSCGSFTQEMCAQLDAGKTVIEPSLGGDTLYLRVWNYNTEEGGNFEICIWEPEIPVNDDCADAIWLNIDTVCNKTAHTNAYASGEPTSVAANPTCGFYQGGDVWFKFVMPASGNLRVEAQGFGMNPQYAVFSGSCGSFTQLFCAQLDGGKTYIDTSVAGDTLYLRVWNYNFNEGGNFQICVWEPPIPVNNNCADAIALTTGSSCVPANYTNRYATRDPSSVGPNPTCGFYQGGDVWFTVQVPSSGLLTIKRQNIANVNAQMALYSGTCGSFTQVACAQLNNTLNFADTSFIGQTLYLRVYGYNTDEGGEFSLCAYNPSPAIITQSNDTTICAGNDAYFAVTATNATSYQWQEDDGNGWSDISNGAVYSGATTTTLSFTSVPSSINGYQYRCIVTGIVSPPDVSDPVTLIVGSAPQFTVTPGNVNVYTPSNACNAVAYYSHTTTGIPLPNYAHFYSGSTTGSGIGNGSSKYFNTGVTTVLVTATNICGVDSATHTVTVIDTLKPVVYCQSGVTVPADSGVCYASNVSLQQPTYSDACGVDTSYNDAPTTYPVGTTNVVWTIIDNHGNSSNCTTDVTVIDTQFPTLSAGSDIYTTTDIGSCVASNVTLNTPVTSDNCSVDSVWDNAPAIFPLGSTLVTVTAKDHAGLQTTASYNVIVSDNILPTISAGTDITMAANSGCNVSGSSINWTAQLSVTDNCSIDTVFSDAPSAFQLGTTQVVWTAIDNSGNVNTDTVNVTVIDTTAPTIVCPGSITVNADNGACVATNVNLSTPAISDNCGATAVNNAPASYPVGVTNVTWTATDNSNNSSSCIQTVTVVDNQMPDVLCKNHTVTLINGTASISVNDINNGSTDNCGIDTMYLSQTVFTTSDIGNNSVALTVIDVNGNSAVCTAIVTVQVPTNNQLSCSITVTPSNNTYTGGITNKIYLGYGPQSVALTGNATGSSGYSYLWAGNGLSCTNCQSPTFVPTIAGTYVFTLTVTDNSNNTTTCDVSICVLDISVSGKKNNNKVYICHNGNTLSVSVNAVNAHLSNHTADMLGKCEDLGCNTAAKGSGNNDTEGAVADLLSITGDNPIGFALFPNPNEGTFKVNLIGNIHEGQLIIRDMLGKMVQQVAVNGNASLTFNMPEVSDGVYIVELKNGEVVYRNRMVIKR